MENNSITRKIFEGESPNLFTLELLLNNCSHRQDDCTVGSLVYKIVQKSRVIAHIFVGILFTYQSKILGVVWQLQQQDSCQILFQTFFFVEWSLVQVGLDLSIARFRIHLKERRENISLLGIFLERKYSFPCGYGVYSF